LLERWFQQDVDQDGDGIPELLNPQIFDLIGQEEHVEKKGGSEYLPYPYLESPGLAAILANDLIKLADLDPAAGRSYVSQFLDVLLNFLDESWDPVLMGYQYRDSISHIIIPGDEVVASLKPGLNLLRLELNPPSRIGFMSSGSGTGGNFQTSIRIHIHGLDWKGKYRIEVLDTAGLDAKTIQDRTLTESIYQRIDYCLLEDRQSEFEIDLYIPGTIRDDITSILPFWLNTDQQDLSKIGVETVLFDKDRFLTPFGFCSISGTESRTIQLTWNTIAGQILLQAGRTKQAYDLFSRWMMAAKVNMNNAGGFYSAWNGISGKGYGRMNGLDSLLPTHFLLSLAGIHLYQDGTIQIEEDYNLPAPITIKIMGYEITREGNLTSFTAPEGDIRSIPGGAEFHLFRD
jgi:hypothetical protein